MNGSVQSYDSSHEASNFTSAHFQLPSAYQNSKLYALPAFIDKRLGG
uniref:Uncharacterized protein n=1 Tax=Anguilla anguilla TaxID=7936 RepID=A0A0E9WRG1_ANGAN